MDLEGGTWGEDSVGLLCNCLDGSAQCYWEDLAKHLPGQDGRGQCWVAVQLSGDSPQCWEDLAKHLPGQGGSIFFLPDLSH